MTTSVIFYSRETLGSQNNFDLEVPIQTVSLQSSGQRTKTQTMCVDPDNYLVEREIQRHRHRHFKS